MSKKKILIIYAKEYPYDVRIFKFCNSLGKAGYEVLLLCRYLDEKEVATEFEHFKVKRVGYGSSRVSTLPIPYNPLWYKAIKESVEQFQPNIIITREMLLAQQSSSVANKYSIPFLIDMAEHYPAAMRAWKKYNSNLISKFLVHTAKIPDLVEKQAVNNADGIIIVCDEQIIRLDEEYSYPTENLVVVNNTPNLRNNFTIKEISQDLIFCHHGNLTADKDIRKFTQAVSITNNKKLNSKFTIAGNGELYDEIQNVAQIGDQNRIEMLGNFQSKDFDKILSNCHIGAVPYQINVFNNHTMYNKVFDYMSFGKPVLVSQNLPMIRIINETNAGYIVDCENIDSISTFLDNFKVSDYKELANNAFIWHQKKYNWQYDEVILFNFIDKFLN